MQSWQKLYAVGGGIRDEAQGRYVAAFVERVGPSKLRGISARSMRSSSPATSERWGPMLGGRGRSASHAPPSRRGGVAGQGTAPPHRRFPTGWDFSVACADRSTGRASRDARRRDAASRAWPHVPEASHERRAIRASVLPSPSSKNVIHSSLPSSCVWMRCGAPVNWTPAAVSASWHAAMSSTSK